MSAKTFVLILMLIGVALAIWAMRRNRVASFDDGSFLYEMAALMVGIGCILLAVGIFAVRLFMAV